MESLGLAGMFTCLPPVRGGAVQIPEYTASTGQRGTASQTRQRGVKQGNYSRQTSSSTRLKVSEEEKPMLKVKKGNVQQQRRELLGIRRRSSGETDERCN